MKDDPELAGAAHGALPSHAAPSNSLDTGRGFVITHEPRRKEGELALKRHPRHDRSPSRRKSSRPVGVGVCSPTRTQRELLKDLKKRYRERERENPAVNRNKSLSPIRWDEACKNAGLLADDITCYVSRSRSPSPDKKGGDNLMRRRPGNKASCVSSLPAITAAGKLQLQRPEGNHREKFTNEFGEPHTTPAASSRETSLSSVCNRFKIIREAEHKVGSLPLPYLRSRGLESLGVVHHLEIMCDRIFSNHRRCRQIAYCKWRDWDRRVADKNFELEMLAFQHAKGMVLLCRIAERQCIMIARQALHRMKTHAEWQKRRLAARVQSEHRAAKIIQKHIWRAWVKSRRQDQLQRRKEMRAKEREQSDREAAGAVLCLEAATRMLAWDCHELIRELSSLELRSRSASRLQSAWRRFKSRQLLYRESIRWRSLYHIRHIQRQEKKWVKWLSPLVEDLLPVIMRTSKAHALAKLACNQCAHILRTQAEAEAYRAACIHAASVIRSAWCTHRDRERYLYTLASIRRIQAGIRHTEARRSLAREVDWRIANTRRLAEKERLRIVALRNQNARILQQWARKCLFHIALQRRFNKRRYILEEQRQNRLQLGVCVFAQYGPRSQLGLLLNSADMKALYEAFHPHEYMAKEVARANALGGTMPEPLAYVWKSICHLEQRAGLLILASYWHGKGRRGLAARFLARKKLIESERRRLLELKLSGASRSISKSWKAAHLRATIDSRSRERMAKRREEAAEKLQKLTRHIIWLHRLRDRFAVRRLLLEAERDQTRFINAAARIRLWYRRRMSVYNSPLRIVARYQIRLRKQREEELYRVARRNSAAKVLQGFFRRRRQRLYLVSRFSNRASRLEAEREIQRRERAALKIQVWYRKAIMTRMLYERFTSRGRKLKEARECALRAALEERAAIRIQRFFRSCSLRVFMQVRFQLRGKALKKQRSMEERRVRELSEAEEVRREQESRMAAEKRAVNSALDLEKAAHEHYRQEWNQKIHQAWALGYAKDKGGTYWYNRITDEYLNAAPKGWKVKPGERWEKRENEKGQRYFFDRLSGQKSWFAPCEECKLEESTKKCQSKPCEGKLWCDKCWAKAHNRGQANMARHTVEKPPNGKDDLKGGEKHCIHCLWRRSELFCRECEDMLCSTCSQQIHATGHRKAHRVIEYVAFKKGWQTIEARTETELTYYYNPLTGESVYQKPQELMQEAELFQHKQYLEYLAQTEMLTKKVEKLQYQMEQALYERDKMQYETEQAQAAMKAESEELKANLEETIAAAVAEAKIGRDKAAEENYKKTLMLTREQRRDQLGENIKLKPPKAHIKK